MIDPQLIQQDIQAVVSSLRPEDRDHIRTLPEEQLISLHHGLGRSLGNAFRSNTYPYLFTHCDEQQTPESRSFDSISSAAIKLIWEHLRNATNVA
jgi:hypothetical protein